MGFLLVKMQRQPYKNSKATKAGDLEGHPQGPSWNFSFGKRRQGPQDLPKSNLTSTTALMMPTFFWKWLQIKSQRSVALPLLCSAMRPFQISLMVFSVKCFVTCLFRICNAIKDHLASFEASQGVITPVSS